jgi:hypothetical protein
MRESEPALPDYQADRDRHYSSGTGRNFPRQPEFYSSKEMFIENVQGGHMFNLVDALFGCAHTRCTLPITLNRSSEPQAKDATDRTGTYVVCLDCGKEFPYDWQQMRIIRPGKRVA